MENFREDLLTARAVYLEGDITAIKAEEILQDMTWLNARGESPITLYIDSPGGSVGPGLVIYDVIQASRAPIVGIVQQQANSMAACILQACRKRLAYASSILTLHSIIIRRSLDELENNFIETLRDAQKNQHRIENIFAGRTQKTLEETKRLFFSSGREGERFIAEKALQENLIDKII